MNKPTRFYSKKQEDRTAKNLGGKVTPNSGAPAFCAGDVKLDNFLIECKTCTTPKQSMSIKKDWILKNKEEAFMQHKRFSALAFDFGGDENYYILDEKTFKYFIRLLQDMEETVNE
jgi:hypothetical protein